MSKKILVIDDEELIRNSFSSILSESGYVVNTVESGEKGIEELYKNNDYNLIFLDLKMPGMDGVETLKYIRNINKQVPVYIISAFHEDYFSKLKEIEHLKLEFELLTKPLNRDQILMIAKIVLDK